MHTLEQVCVHGSILVNPVVTGRHCRGTLPLEWVGAWEWQGYCWHYCSHCACLHCHQLPLPPTAAATNCCCHSYKYEGTHVTSGLHGSLSLLLRVSSAVATGSAAVRTCGNGTGFPWDWLRLRASQSSDFLSGLTTYKHPCFDFMMAHICLGSGRPTPTW